MYHSLDHFSKAYQSELLRNNAHADSYVSDYPTAPNLWKRFLQRLGDGLISLGEGMKGEEPCVERVSLSQRSA